VFVVHATARLLAQLKARAPGQVPPSTTSLGAWFANMLRWRSPVALFVNESTLLPVLLPLAPARTLGERFPAALGQVLETLGAPAWFVDAELAQMDSYALAKTANRSTVGMLNEFAFLADAHRDGPGTPDLTALALRLAGTPCGPLHKTHVFPDRALSAHIALQDPPRRRLRLVSPDDPDGAPE
jgi:hypothetical protein